eukprot:jgi/Botrbrau1/22304/Bobra.0138s0055.1
MASKSAGLQSLPTTWGISSHCTSCPSCIQYKRCGGLGGPELHDPACNIPHCPPPNNSLFTNTWLQREATMISGCAVGRCKTSSIEGL